MRPTRPGGSVDRLTLHESKRFAETIRGAMNDAGLHSVYSLFLLTSVSRATLHRWLNGEVRIPVAGARAIVAALTRHSERCDTARIALSGLLMDAQSADGSEFALRKELRARRVPVRRTIEALRAARLLPNSSEGDSA